MADKVRPAERSRIMAAVKSKDTAPEMVVRRLVYAMGYRYRLHVRGMPGTPDLVFRSKRRIVNVNGCFWHMHGCGRCRIPATRRDYWLGKLCRNRERDKRTLGQLRRAGWHVLVVWECQMRNVAALEARLRRFLDAPSRRQQCAGRPPSIQSGHGTKHGTR